MIPSRRVVRSLVVLLLALTAACRDALDTGGVANLTVVPRFSAGRATSALVLTVDSVHVNVRRAGALVAQAGKAVTPQDTEVTLDVRVAVQQRPDVVEVELLLLAAGSILFSGTTTVTLQAGASTTPAEIPLAYVGADSAVAWLDIAPRDTILTVGDSLQFDAQAYGVQEQKIDPFFASWSAVPAGPVTPVGLGLSRNGLLRAPSNRTQVYVKATAGNGVSDSVLVVFTPPLGAIAKFSPDSGSVAGGQTFGVAVRVTDASGQPVPHVPVGFNVTTLNGYPYYPTVSTDTFGIARVEVYAYTLPVGTNLQPLQVEALANGLPPVTFTTAVVSFLVPAAPLATGVTHTCQIRSGGALYCWGANTSGQLGDGSRTSHLVPTPAATGLTLVAVTAGSDHTCGLNASGSAYCWGANTTGQLGDSTTITRLTPVAVAGALQFTQLAAGAGFTCGLIADGTAYCWGNGATGQLGNGGTAIRTAPTPVNTTYKFQALSVFGDNHACGLYGSFPICWGYNADGELGDSTTTTQLNPVLVKGDLYLAQIASGWFHTCGIDYYSGAAWCWGDNNSWQLGWGTPPQDAYVPGAVQGGHAFISLAAGGGHTCGRLSNETVYCWGSNQDGGLGDGTTTWSLAPVPVSGGLAFRRLSVGDGFTCGLTAGGALYCWGRNSAGQLGDGSTTSRSAPVLIP
jgi:alpha-tubulin suppressor-like RCC1 family protein